MYAHRRNWSQFRCRISLFWQLPTEATLLEPVLPKENGGLHTPLAGFGGPSPSPAFCCTTFIDSKAICPNNGQSLKTSEGMSPSPRFSISAQKNSLDWIEMMDYCCCELSLQYKWSRRIGNNDYSSRPPLCWTSHSHGIQRNRHRHVRGDKLPALSFAGKAKITGCAHGLLGRYCFATHRR